MRSLRTTVTAAVMLVAASAVALPPRTFVSAKTGSDANTATNCALTTPCRNFTAALSVTTAGGEVVVLDSGGFGVVTIDRAIAIIGPPGVYAGISGFSGNAITVNAPSDALVTLRGLTLNGVGALAGVNCLAAGELVVEDAHISNFTESGLRLAGPGKFRVSRSSFIANTKGVWASAPGQSGISAFGQVLESYFESASVCGVRAEPGAAIDVVDSAAFNGYIGFEAMGGVLSCTRCIATHNQYGIGADFGGTGYLNHCTITHNSGWGEFSLSATLESMGNSMVESNGTDVLFGTTNNLAGSNATTLAPQPDTVPFPQRTFVSAAAGSDANTSVSCPLTAPCRTFAAAIAVTSGGGEIIALDSGGFGPVSINGPMTLIGPPGVYAAITASSNAAVWVNAPSRVVVLRGLTLNGTGANFGIGVLGVGELIVEKCHISNFTTSGLGFSGPGAIRVSGSDFTNNGTAGIQLSGSLGAVFAEIISTEIDENDHGILASNGAVVEAVDVSSTNNNAAFEASSGATVSCTRCVAFHNEVGFQIDSDTAGSFMRLNDCTITQSTFGIRASDTPPFVSTIGSMGINMIRANSISALPTITPLTPK